MKRKINYFTPMENLIKILEESKLDTNCDIEKNVVQSVQDLIQEMILDDVEEDSMISFYMMTRKHVNENMTPEEEFDELNFAKASFAHNFNAKHEYKKHINHLTKNN